VSNIPTQGNSILVDTPDSAGGTIKLIEQPGQQLTSWVVGKVQPWEDHRDRGYGKKFAEYWRMWRGTWAEDDKNRQSERSRLVAPALSQAIDQTVSEIEEAVFSKEVWFDVVDNLEDEEKLDALQARDYLLEDFEVTNVKDALSESILNAAIFGTGIVTVSVEVMREEKPTRNAETQQLEAYGKDRVYVCVTSVRPDEFIPDPAGANLQEMLGVAIRKQRPLHGILEKIESGLYRRDALASLAPIRRPENRDIDADTDPQSNMASTDSDSVDVIEYHGKVPLKFLDGLKEKKSELDEILAADLRDRPDEGDGPLVEAIVTIANGSVLLRATVNPFTMKDRSVIAFQFDKVPGRFWGRGVAEKGYNPQKALDAEIRARIDALAFVSSPMLGVDSGRVPRGFKMEIKPGKVWLTQGPPAEVLQPVAVGDINPNTFNQASEMERMVQMGTGAFDTATSLKNQSQSGSNSLSANSMLMGAFVKRAKRSIANVNRNLITPVIKKSLWRYMQFAPQRYPSDYTFMVKDGMGIIAREVEAMQMTQLIGMMPEQFGQVSLTLIQGVIEHTSLPNKSQIIQQINAALQPPSEEEQQKQKQLSDLQFQAAMGQAQSVLLQNQKTIAEMRKILAEAVATAKKGDVEDDKLLQEHQKILLMQQEIEQFAEQNKIAMARLDLQAQQLELKRQELAKKPAASAKK
jgi:flagellar biosynthesis regulator FlaF